MEPIQLSLRRLERRDWWLWWTAVVVMLLLTFAVVSLSFPVLLRDTNVFFRINLDLAVRGLVGLVLLFNTYNIYQQILIKRLRRELAEQMRVAAVSEMRAAEFEKLAVLDPLTGLYNRRFAEERLAAEVSRSHRHAHPLSAAVLDLDDFKQINDRYGHPAGDQVLKEFAQQLNRAIRVSDLAVRTGGDEFLVIFPDCRPGEVEHLLARLTRLEVDFHGNKIPLTFSAGWVDYQSGETPAQLLERADQALYASKRTGKSRPVPTPRGF